MRIYSDIIKRCAIDIDYFSKKYVKVSLFHNNTIENFGENCSFRHQTKILRRAQHHGKYIAACCRKSGKSLMSAISAIHSLLFGQEQRIILVKTSSNAKDLSSDTIQSIIDNLPHWMVKDIKRVGKYEWRWKGDVNILKIVHADPYSIKCCIPTHVIFDEVDVSNHDEFILTIYPILTYLKVKVTGYFTPLNKDNFMSILYEYGKEGINNYVTDTITWKDMNYDNQWYDFMVNAIGLEAFDQEYNCQV